MWRGDAWLTYEIRTTYGATRGWSGKVRDSPTEYETNVEIDFTPIENDMLTNQEYSSHSPNVLWDAHRHTGESQAEAQNPYIVVRIWEQDPEALALARYGKSYNTLSETEANKLYAEGVVALQFVGMPLAVDQHYIDEYMVKVNVGDTEANSLMRILIFVGGAVTFIVSLCPTAPNPAGVIFGMDMMVTAITGTGLLDMAIRGFAILFGASAETMSTFSIWSLAGWSTNWLATVVNIGWSIAFFWAVSYGINYGFARLMGYQSYAKWMDALQLKKMSLIEQDAIHVAAAAEPENAALQQAANAIDDFVERVSSAKNGWKALVDELDDIVTRARQAAIEEFNQGTARLAYEAGVLTPVSEGGINPLEMTFQQFKPQWIEAYVRNFATNEIVEYIGRTTNVQGYWIGSAARRIADTLLSGYAAVNLVDGAVSGIFFMDNVPLQGIRQIGSIIFNKLVRWIKKIPGAATRPLSITSSLTQKLVGMGLFLAETCFWTLFSPMGFKGLIAALGSNQPGTINPYTWQGHAALFG